MKYFILICGLLFLTGCSQSFFADTEETITLTFPDWPPDNNNNIEYPPLSRWLLKTGTTGNTNSSFLSPACKSVTIKVQKNQPFCATLQPITKTQLNNEPETVYFYPAGLLYPYSDSTSGTKLTWEQGYLASVMLSIINSKKETGVTAAHINDFIANFNWKKAQETIDKKINSESSPYYNPWLLNTSDLLNKLCYGNFQSSCLTLSGCHAITLENINSLHPDRLLSPFIPENQHINLMETKAITIKKETPTLVTDGKIFGTIITVQSLKNISKEIVYLPIYIEDI